MTWRQDSRFRVCVASLTGTSLGAQAVILNGKRSNLDFSCEIDQQVQ